MNTTSRSRAEAPGRPLVWDAPVRVFHWLMVLSFAGAYLTAESESWRLLHVTLGYTLAGLVAFRLVWGLIGTRYARFADFVRGPRAVGRYLQSLRQGRPARRAAHHVAHDVAHDVAHHLGHNPAGAWAIVALLGLSVLVTASGWAVYNDLGPEALEELHELAANTMLAVVVAHVLGVIVSSRLHRENLVASMVHGHKLGDPAQGIAHARRALAAVMLMAVLAFWAWQWRTAPTADASHVARASEHSVNEAAGPAHEPAQTRDRKSHAD